MYLLTESGLLDILQALRFAKQSHVLVVSWECVQKGSHGKCRGAQIHRQMIDQTAAE